MARDLELTGHLFNFFSSKLCNEVKGHYASTSSLGCTAARYFNPAKDKTEHQNQDFWINKFIGL